MGIAVVIAVGAILGWLASIVVRTAATADIMLNMVVGVTGALISALLVAGAAIVPSLSVLAMLSAISGALALLSVVCIFRRHPA